MNEPGRREPERREPDERLADWVDGRMNERERERFAAELRVSPLLRQDLAEYERTVAAVRAALGAPVAPTRLADRVFAALAADANRRAAAPSVAVRWGGRSWSRIVWSAASAAALLLLALWVDSWSSGPATKLQLAVSAPAAVDAKERAAGGDAEAKNAADKSGSGGLPVGENPVGENPAGDDPAGENPAGENGAPKQRDLAGAQVEPAGAADRLDQEAGERGLRSPKPDDPAAALPVVPGGSVAPGRSVVPGRSTAAGGPPPEASSSAAANESPAIPDTGQPSVEERETLAEASPDRSTKKPAAPVTPQGPGGGAVGDAVPPTAEYRAPKKGAERGEGGVESTPPAGLPVGPTGGGGGGNPDAELGGPAELLRTAPAAVVDEAWPLLLLEGVATGQPVTGQPVNGKLQEDRNTKSEPTGSGRAAPVAPLTDAELQDSMDAFLATATTRTGGAVQWATRRGVLQLQSVDPKVLLARAESGGMAGFGAVNGGLAKDDAAAIERLWLVVGDATDVGLLLQRVGLFAQASRWQLSSGELDAAQRQSARALWAAAGAVPAPIGAPAPSTVAPLAAGSATGVPSAAGPSAAGPSAAGPSAAGPSTGGGATGAGADQRHVVLRFRVRAR